jgi:hypothetical protein
MKQIIIILSSLLFFSCQQKSNNDFITINIDKTKTVNFTDLFKEYYMVFPESTDSSLIGAMILRIEAYNERIYLLNMRSSGNNILCFNKDGNFLFSIDKIGYGPEEYTILNDFFIDKKLNHLILLVESGKIMHLNMDGKYLYSKQLDELFTIRYIQEFNDSLLLHTMIAKI